MTSRISIRLIGPQGEPVNFKRCLLSHGVADLPPYAIDKPKSSLRATLYLGGTVRTVTVTSNSNDSASISVMGTRPSPDLRKKIRDAVTWIFRLDEDLSPFYEAIRQDSGLSWAVGAGRMIRCQSVFEDVIKTICTTNCSWSSTERMVNALVMRLGEPARATKGEPLKTFPSAYVLAMADDSFYRDIVRAGYRTKYIKAISEQVAFEDLDLEVLRKDHQAGLSDEEVEQCLLSLPGIGPYAAAHIMMMLGRYSRLILDSWTRPTYARIMGRESISDAEITRRFKQYGAYAGLAFWLTLTKGWLGEEEWKDTVR